MTVASLVVEMRKQREVMRREGREGAALKLEAQKRHVVAEFGLYCEKYKLADLFEEMTAFLKDAGQHLHYPAAYDVGALGTLTVDGMRIVVELIPDSNGNVKIYVYAPGIWPVRERWLLDGPRQTRAEDVARWVAEEVDAYLCAHEYRICTYQARVVLAEKIVALAPRYLKEFAAYAAACSAHAAAETRRLWEPFRVWRVRYTAVSGTAGGSEEEGASPAAWCFSLTPPQRLAGSPVTLLEVEMYGGETRERVIGALLDGVTAFVGNDEPGIGDEALFHRAYPCGLYWINVPPTVKEEPAPLACEAVPPFREWLAARGIGYDGPLNAYEIVKRGMQAVDLDWVREIEMGEKSGEAV